MSRPQQYTDDLRLAHILADSVGVLLGTAHGNAILQYSVM